MDKILLENRLPQVLPILLRDKENPKTLVQSQILRRGRKLVAPIEMSRHVSSLANKGYIRITYMKGVKTPEVAVAEVVGTIEATASPEPRSSGKKKTTKKGRR